VLGDLVGGGPSAMELALEANRAALERNTAAIEQSIVGSAPGDTITKSLQAVLATIAGTGPGLPTGTPVNVYKELLEDELEELGLTLDDLKDVVSDLLPNIVLTYTGLGQIRDALQLLTSDDLMGTLSGQMDLLGQEWALLDITDPGSKIEAVMASLFEFIGEDLEKALMGVDWTDPNEFLQELMASIRGGTFDLGQLEGISLDEFMGVIGQLEAFGDELSGANEELAQFANSIRNAPAGFKIALGRFEATTPQGRDVIRTDPPGSGRPPINIAVVNINDPIATGKELLEQVEKEAVKAANRGGVGTLQTE